VQASETISDNSGHRVETSVFSETDHAGTGPAKATFRMDFTQGRKELHRTAEGAVHLTLAGPELDATRTAQEAGDPHGPAWDVDPPDQGARSPSGGPRWEVVQAGPDRPSAPLSRAILQARLGNHDVHIEVRPADGGRPHRYRASPDGSLHNEDGWTDAGFAEAFAGMHESLARLADENGIDLRRLYERSPVPGSLSDKVRAELTRLKVPLPPEAMRLPPDRSAAAHSHGPSLGGLPGDGASAAGGFGGGG
jgi:hypothetical protein